MAYTEGQVVIYMLTMGALGVLMGMLLALTLRRPKSHGRIEPSKPWPRYGGYSPDISTSPPGPPPIGGSNVMPPHPTGRGTWWLGSQGGTLTWIPVTYNCPDDDKETPS